MYLHDSLVCQANMLKRTRAHLQNFEDQARDVGEALRLHRLAWEKAEKKEEELWIAFLVVQYDLEKKDWIYRERHDFIKKLEAKNKGLQEMIVSLTEELSTTGESMKASEEWAIDLEKIATALHEDLSSTWEKSSEVDELREERMKLITRCGELEKLFIEKQSESARFHPRCWRKLRTTIWPRRNFKKRSSSAPWMSILEASTSVFIRLESWTRTLMWLV